ncbi:hypothetical protein PRSY57_0416500 [Plasmodium reichenowi]|uniref:Uncharacterized protein n=1 Tax=Plasmodium reichenowi TaxID=5854 RepID=A0A151LSJ6_PLARE|nr:hypothetical protein PRSY57_0416500 [Plasmodium reichenowi]KYO02156.1 hypothetical protein PRSY57_0416500 [Plasmodium reichenowi]
MEKKRKKLHIKKKDVGKEKKKNDKLKNDVLKEKKPAKAPTILRWIDLLRSMKLTQLKKSIDEELNNYEINKNINDKLLLFLNDDLEEKQVLEKIDELKNSKMYTLVEMHTQNMNKLQEHFEEEIKKMFDIFEEDRKLLIQNRDSIVHNINLFYSRIEERDKLRKENLEKDENHTMNEIYKNYIAEKYIANYKYEKYNEEDNKIFDNLIIENKKILNEEYENYNIIEKKYEKNRKCLLSKEKEVHELEIKIDNWKIKLENEMKIYDIQTERLKNEKTQLLNHIRAIKLILQKLKHNDKQRLIDITTHSMKCINKLEENIALANKLINMDNLCRKFESEREKLMASINITTEKREEDDLTLEKKNEQVDNEISKNVYQAYLLEPFFKRKNKALLDIILLKKELRELKKKNKQYSKTIDELDNKLSFNKKVKIKKEDFVIRAS